MHPPIAVRNVFDDTLRCLLRERAFGIDDQPSDFDIQIFFGGVQRLFWRTDGSIWSYEIVNNPLWLREFCARTFQKFFDEWLMPTLNLSAPYPIATGLELQCVNSAGIEICAISLDNDENFFMRPVAHLLLEHSSAAMVKLIKSRVVRVNVVLTSRDDKTFGCSLRRAIEGNVLDNDHILKLTEQCVAENAVLEWVKKERKQDDPWEPMALIQNAHNAVSRWPAQLSKSEVRAWQSFLERLAISDLRIILCFCPRPMTVHGRKISSRVLDKLGPMSEGRVENILRALAKGCALMMKPRFSAKMLHDIVTPLSVACAPESIIDLRSGDTAVPKDLFVDEQERDAIENFLKRADIEFETLSKKSFAVMGRVTTVDTLLVESRITLKFVDKSVIASFDEKILLLGSTFRCHKNGLVAIYAFAKLVWLIQNERTEESKELKQKIKRFHTNTQLGFPAIDGIKRKKKKIYYDDVYKSFFYYSDKSSGTPDSLHPVQYTRHMYEKLCLDIWN
jgi:hypothetical protein